ncbi:MgtC/SapB family protein [Clostridium sartagoforme]|uniref:MgtC/SapB family protein n=1 Tax=Clostridium sartagoforme TaxID=84031 RepID=A0A4S2DE50_9CLOT|nr:MgtC/SapB family protein [Clostridium sartagoforme]TGY40226.1 MgtC/SapB family protein [Clostridium sartagoforme]
MSEFFTLQLEYLLRLLIAALCGLAIGYEREIKLKDAGIKTHFIVAVGSALVMIISKYGFQDLVGLINISIDPTRIASQVISGVGFIGAGLIFIKEKSIVGLTTAAGIWATAGIGLAIGSGLYFIGLSATIIVIIGQIFLHRNIKWVLCYSKTEILSLIIDGNPLSINEIKKIITAQNISIIKIKGTTSKSSSSLISLEIEIKVEEDFDKLNLISILQDNPIVKSIKF